MNKSLIETAAIFIVAYLVFFVGVCIYSHFAHPRLLIRDGNAIYFQFKKEQE